MISREEFDFIVVGAGPSGCTLATRIANTRASPRVLLVEAGGENADHANRADADRWIHRMIPSQNWGYQSIPQEHLGGTVIPLDRGKGLGGTS
jgi:choline dehydrogenase-like flavoprotein